MPGEGRTRGTRRRDEGANRSRALRETGTVLEPPAAVASSSAAIPSTSTSTRDDASWQEVGGKNRRQPGARKQQQRQHQQHQHQHQHQQRLGTKPQPKPQPKRAAAVVDPRRGGVGGGSNNTSTSTGSASTSRQQAARSASSRREYTLFDHLLTTSAPPPPTRRRSGVDWSLNPGGASQQPAQPPLRGQATPTPAPPAAPSGVPSKEPHQRRPASQQARQGASAPGDRGATAQQVLRPADSAALQGGGEGGRFKKTGPSPSSSARRNGGGHAPPNRVLTKSSDAPKPGKQRLGPRKKKLSPLKKKILLDRLEKWRAIHKDPAPANVDGQGVCDFPLLSHVEGEASPSLLPPTGPPCAGDMGDDGAGGSGGGGGGGRGQTRLWVVAIYNLVDEEDVEDGDDHAEVERDLWEMASTFGAVRSVEVPRGAAHFDGAGGLPAAKVAFASAEEAEHAKRGFHGRIVGGKSLRVEIEDTGNTPRGDTSTGRNTDAPAVWRVAVENLIDEEDDLDDEDEYAEVCADISAMMGVHGTLIEVDVPRGRLGESEKVIGGHPRDDSSASADQSAAAAAEGRVVTVTFGSQAEAEACVKDINGRRVGGKELNANLFIGQSRAGSDSSGPTQQRRDDGSAIGTAAGCVGSTKRAGATNSTPPSADADTIHAGGGATCADTWRVVIRNLIDEDDLIDDDDDYGEVRSDVTALVSAYGSVTRLCIPRNRAAAGEEGADAHDGAEPGEAVAVFASPEEAEACARGLSGRKIAGKILEAQFSKKPRPSQPGVETQAEAGPGSNGPAFETQGASPQSDRPSVVPDVHGSGSGVARGVEPPAVRAGAGAQPNGGVAAPASMKGGKRMPTKYKEAAALPKPPGMSGGGSPNAYVYQSPDKEVDELVFEMLQLLFKFQERARLADPAKSKIRRRIVMGLREVLRGVKAKKVRLLIVAPNVDAVGGEGGLDEKVVQIIDSAREGETPVVFALSKRKIGKALGKTIKVSAVGVYSFDGANEQQKQLKRRLEAIHSLPQPAPLGGDPT